MFPNSVNRRVATASLAAVALGAGIVGVAISLARADESRAPTGAPQALEQRPGQYLRSVDVTAKASGAQLCLSVVVPAGPGDRRDTDLQACFAPDEPPLNSGAALGLARAIESNGILVVGLAPSAAKSVVVADAAGTEITAKVTPLSVGLPGSVRLTTFIAELPPSFDMRKVIARDDADRTIAEEAPPSIP